MLHYELNLEKKIDTQNQKQRLVTHKLNSNP